MRNLKAKLYILFFILIIVSGCTYHKDDSPFINAQTGVLKNFTGLDGCSWVIQLDNNKNLEPTNLDEFVSNKVDGQRVGLTYKLSETGASICMVGEVVDIISLRLK